MANDYPDALNTLISHAVQARATDIHIDTWQSEAVTRFRIDGQVQSDAVLSVGHATRLINQAKVAAELDIDALTPQEGHLRWQGDQKTIDARITTVPAAPHHTSVHIRLLPATDSMLDIDQLGLTEQQSQTIAGIHKGDHYLALICGPTGSGKTTTLYAMLTKQDLPAHIAVSIEEPAEFDLPYVRQIEINHRHKLDMANALRLALRIDPDVLAVGEVRDPDSAQIAARAALSGRRVLATMHANDPASAIDAIHYLGVPFYVLAGTQPLIIAQDLVRLLCDQCKQPKPITDEQRGVFDGHGFEAPDHLEQPTGCDHCQQIGYFGRTGIFEIVAFTSDDIGWLSKGPHQAEVRQVIRDRGIVSLQHQALTRVADGVTTLSEVFHLLQKQDD